MKKNIISRRFIIRDSLLSGTIFCGLMMAINRVYADEYFNPALLDTSNTSVTDLSHFEDGNQEPGVYHVDVFVNNENIDVKDISFTHDKTAKLAPCLSLQQLKDWAIKTNEYPDLLKGDEKCVDLTAIPQAQVTFDFNHQKLNLSIPQIAMDTQSRGYVPTDKWDDGITTFLMNYSLAGSQTASRSQEGKQNSQYLNLRPGFNIGPWRYRNYSTWNRDSDGKSAWESVYNYLSRDIRALKSQLVLGDSNTPSDVFDSVAFTGAQLASSEEMLTDSEKGFAPVLNGIARTNATVSVKQNGYTIYQTTVAPGAFQINDIFPTGGSGDLELVVAESDGSEQHIIVPFASLPVMQRAGHLKYSSTVGKTRFNASHDDESDTEFAQGSLMYGLPHDITLYGGVQVASDVYSAAALGIGWNMGVIGAVSVDVTQSHAQISQPQTSQRQSQKGHSVRMRYSKNFLNTGTNVLISGYRYSTDGYYTLQEAMTHYTSEDGDSDNGRTRSRTDLTLSQETFLGALSLSLVQEQYWAQSKMSSVSLGYSNSWHSVNYNVNYSYRKNTGDSDSENNNSNDRQIALSFSVPFSLFSTPVSVSYSMSGGGSSAPVQNVNMSGNALQDDSLQWNVQMGYQGDGRQYNSNVSANYNARYGNVSAGLSHDPNADRLSYGLQGGMVIHDEGITLSQPIIDTAVLVKAPDVANVPVNNQAGVRTNNLGYAVLPYATPYRKNNVSLNTESLEDGNIELVDTNKTVIPTRGAVVKAEYQTSVGYRALITLMRPDKSFVPFGAMVENNAEDKNRVNSALVGDEGVVYLTGLENKGQREVQWGNGADQRCIFDFTIPSVPSASGIEIFQAICH
ncbi:MULTISPECIES: fimbria/pilus outer membrane usher protein [Enterobacterales]|uniref:fimbria/pilus outer membrane usher protein n=1 Tax=Enterobacterales TaxID=91347 RepID=UPI0039EA8C33